MNKERIRTLQNRLEKYGAKNVKFHDAKKQLMSEGYSDTEISIAVTSGGFNSGANTGRAAPNPDQLSEADKLVNEQIVNAQSKRFKRQRIKDAHVASVGRHAKYRKRDRRYDAIPLRSLVVAGLMIVCLAFAAKYAWGISLGWLKWFAVFWAIFIFVWYLIAQVVDKLNGGITKNNFVLAIVYGVIFMIAFIAGWWSVIEYILSLL